MAERVSYPKVAEQLLATRPEQLLPTTPASAAEVVQHLPNKCPTVAEKLPQKPGIGPNSAKIGRVWPHSACLGHVLVGVGQLWPRLGRIRSMFVSILDVWGNCSLTVRQFMDNCWTTFGQLRSSPGWGVLFRDVRRAASRQLSGNSVLLDRHGLSGDTVIVTLVEQCSTCSRIAPACREN